MNNQAIDPQRRRLTVSNAGSAGAGDSFPSVLSQDILDQVCKQLAANSKRCSSCGVSLQASDTFCGTCGEKGKPVQDEVILCHSQTDPERKDKRTFGEKDKFSATVEQEMNRSSDVFFTCRKGRKPEAPNQDSYVSVVCKGRWSLFGVFDGHGPHGHDVSDYALKVLVSRFFEQDYLRDTEEAFRNSFDGTQKDLFKIVAEKRRPFDPTASGSTCTMAFHNLQSDELILAHAGDSRGVLYHGGVANHSTLDHKPNLPEEKKRIEGAGGRVVFDGYYNYRVFARAGSYPGLNMSRALGDTRAHDEAGLTAEPELKRIALKPLRDRNPDLTLLVCTDGVWEFIDEAAAFIHFKKSEDSKLLQGQKAANDLAQESFEKWMQDSENEISDDITVLVANLSIPS